MKSVLAVLIFLTLAVPAPAQQAADIFRVETGGAFLGIQLEDVTADNVATYKLSSERGVIVRSVEKGSPAEAAGLRQGDVILEYAATPVFSSMQLSRLVRETPPGRKVDLAVSREGKRVALAAKVTERQDTQMGRAFRPIPRGNADDSYGFQGPEGRGFTFRFPRGLEGFNEDVRPAGRPRLGVNLQPLTDQMAAFLGVAGKQGVLVSAVTEGSAAAGKLKAGDVIVRADGKPVGAPEELSRIVQDKEGALDLGVIRDKKEMTVSVTLPELGRGTRRSGGYRL